MRTKHKIFIANSQRMPEIPDSSVHLVVTSPPYPMIKMWDSMFTKQNGEIGKALETGDAFGSFEMMHRQLDAVWQEVERVLKPGGIACINIGDATRTIGGNFKLG